MALNKTAQWMLESDYFQNILSSLSCESQVSFVQRIGFPENSDDWNLLALTRRLYTLKQEEGLLIPNDRVANTMNQGAVNACRACYEDHSATWELDESDEEPNSSGCINCSANDPDTQMLRVFLPPGSCRVCQEMLRQSQLAPRIDVNSDTFLCLTCSVAYTMISGSHSALNEHVPEHIAELRRRLAALRADFEGE